MSGEDSPQNWRAVCAFDELADPDARGFEHAGWASYGFIVRQGRQVFGYINVCPHAGHPLNYQPHAFLTRDRAQIICSSHGAMFELSTGVCIAGPCPGRQLKPVPVRIRDEQVQICIADTAAGD